MKVAITGTSGLVGSRLVELLKNDFEFFPLSQQQMDITNKKAVQTTLTNLDFDLLLHCAAYTNVDGAEHEKELAYKINVEGTRNVLEAVLKKQKKFIYLSTGFVFDGLTPPYYEDSKPHPLGYYAQTKYEGEKVVNSQGMIVRIDTPYRASYAARTDFVRTMMKLLKEGKELKMIADLRITPTFIDDLASALKYLTTHFSPEIFHIVGSDSMSPYTMVLQIADVFSLNKNLVKQTTYKEFLKDKAKRPKFLDMKSKKNNFAKMRTLAQGLQEVKLQLLM